MTPDAAIGELLARVGGNSGEPVEVSEYELAQWPDAAVEAMRRQGLLQKTRVVKSAVCPECEEHCNRPVHLASRGDERTAIIVCDRRSDVGRVEVSLDHFRQWQCAPEAVCAFIADVLALRRSGRRHVGGAEIIEIGMARGERRTQMLSLKFVDELRLVAGSGDLPLDECLLFDGYAYSLDGAAISRLVDAANTGDERYTPSNAKREARKLATRARYAEWQKAYRKLRKQRPSMPDTWYAQQIAKQQPSGEKRNPSTIKKHMKA